MKLTKVCYYCNILFEPDYVICNQCFRILKDRRKVNETEST